jgi:hypothetical protein
MPWRFPQTKADFMKQAALDEIAAEKAVVEKEKARIANLPW